jgi:hypothetical protein
MSRDELPQLLSMAPPRAGSSCAYLSSSILYVGLSRLPGRLRGEPSEHGIVGVFAGNLRTL